MRMLITMVMAKSYVMMRMLMIPLSMHLFNLENEFNKNRLWFFGPTSQIGVFPIQCG